MMKRLLDPDMLEAVSGGAEWTLESSSQDKRDAVPGTQSVTAGQGADDALIGAGFMDRAALKLDRLKGNLTNDAVKKGH